MFMMLYGAVVMLIPDTGYNILVLVLSVYLIVYGAKIMVYYFLMARMMVGGKSVLYKSIILLDTGIITASFSTVRPVYLILYLVGIYAAAGVVSILRSVEARRYNAPLWKFKLVSGILSILIAVSAVVFGLFFHSSEIPVYIYGGGVIYSGIVSIVTAFHKEQAIYIQ